MKRVFALLLCLVMAAAMIPAAAAEDIGMCPGLVEIARYGDIGHDPDYIDTDLHDTDRSLSYNRSLTLYVDPKPAITTQPTSQTASAGAAAATLRIKATAARDGCQYRCRASNANGWVYTDPVTLMVQ